MRAPPENANAALAGGVAEKKTEAGKIRPLSNSKAQAGIQAGSNVIAFPERRANDELLAHQSPPFKWPVPATCEIFPYEDVWPRKGGRP
jgi:hypothetical protein